MPHHRMYRAHRPIAVSLVAVAALVAGTGSPGQAAPPASESAHAAAATPTPRPIKPHFTKAVAHDESAPLRVLAKRATSTPNRGGPNRVVPERGVTTAPVDGFTGDSAVQKSAPAGAPSTFPIRNFDGLRNRDNADLFGFRVNPPDTVGDVGRSQYVEMVNLAFAVYSKTGKTELGPTPIGDLWQGFRVKDCTDPSGDPVVLYDQLADRWILTQFTTRGFSNPSRPFFNCVAVSKTSDATGGYFRYAFTTGFNFPDYPKYSVWTNSYVLTTREFGPTNEYGIGVYGLEKAKMIQGKPARAVSFFIDGNDPQLLPLVGDGLLPADIDGPRGAPPGSAIPLVGTQDDNWVYGAKRDALNVWDFRVQWSARPTASLMLADQIPVAPFDTNFPCHPDSRDCLPQPGIKSRTRYLDTLATRQRPTFRLAYRNFGGYESLVTNQTVESSPGMAGVRWYEIRRNRTAEYSLFQQGTYAPNDGINRWMGSIAQDKRGNLGLGYSVVNGSNVFPGIRFTGRFAGDAPGVMTLKEGIIQVGSGVQTDTNSRWGDYTSMSIDPVDDCTMWYANEYYTQASQQSSSVGWKTRIASFKMPGC